MGRSFTCAYLKSNDVHAAPLRDRLTAALRCEGFEPSEEPADRWLALLSTAGSSWRFLLDSANAEEPPFAPDLRKAARKLSKALGCDMLCAEAVDSDAFAAMFCGGGAEDMVVRDPGEGYDNLGCGPRTGKGKPALWQAFFGLSDTQTQSLQALWDGDFVFAEEQLAEFFTLLGLDNTGLNLFPEELEASELPEGRSLELLHFRAKQKPFEIITEGETVIDLSTRNVYIEPGKPACDSFFNVGGITKGASFLLISELFREFHGTFSDVTIEKKTDRDTHSWMNCEVHTAQFEPITLPDGQTAMIARFPEFIFPEGIQINREAVTSWKAVQDAQWVRSVIVRYTMLTCPEDVPENTVITAMLLPNEGRALKVVPLRLRPRDCGWESDRADFLQVLKEYGYEEEKS